MMTIHDCLEEAIDRIFFEKQIEYDILDGGVQPLKEMKLSEMVNSLSLLIEDILEDQKNILEEGECNED